jgi:hypothetical protein
MLVVSTSFILDTTFLAEMAADQRAGCISNANLPFLSRLRGDFGREIFFGNFS